MTTRLDVEITLTDLEAARQVLGACETFLSARDMMEAQLALRDYRPSALAAEVERLRSRFDAYMADRLLAERDAEEEAAEAAEAELEVEEELADEPLGSADLPKQQGRRISKEELAASVAARDAEAEAADGDRSG